MLQLDVRTKLLLVVIFSVLALVYQNPKVLALLLVVNILTLSILGLPLAIFRGFYKFIGLYVLLIVIQSFFVKSGEPLLKLGEMYLLTTDGIWYGLAIILRFLILAASGLFLMHCNPTELTLALVKLRLPYEIVLMVQIGIRFIPVFINELQNTFNAIQLRGVDLRRVYKRKVLRVYVSIFSPLLYSVWQKAEKLSILLELRGFRKVPVRTYYRDIALSRTDYVIMATALLMTAIFVYAVKGL
ncbi:MAG: energy-coupling factor transporter transmembrane protein EcfT [Clostridia bacterium]|nr:energy-coupling factor transporter transmembrane protein EcfT [Clostridia bacterium]